MGEYIVHTHAKDGLRGTQPPYLEAAWGQGDVKFGEYLAALNDVGFKGFLPIERECGDNPEADMRMAVKFLKDLIK